ncbi:hypothetical protein O181_105147 [Austropuccinia psidii MF-1]|uniref:Integrase zinc-binding domain-containing protein n=1 Tax=Austropuccinia psidii MF-1 TaxID=1389203 RepID=A0A9Q3PM53_9BASI|nr:hypothetical protein [Austropuccinia psidii MF-1]
MTLKDRVSINTIIHECIDRVVSGDLSEDRTLERVKTCSRWPNWRTDVVDYCQTCYRYQKANSATGKRFGMIIQIQEPKYPWEVIHMDWGTATPPGEDRSFNVCLLLLDMYSKTPMFVPCHSNDTAIDTAITVWNRVISHTGLLKNLISGRDHK